MDREKIREEIDEQVNFGGITRLGLVPINNLLWIVERVESETAERCRDLAHGFMDHLVRKFFDDAIRKEFGLDKPGDEKSR